MKKLVLIISALICGIAVAKGTTIARQTTMSLRPDTDTLAFVDYLKKNGQDPKSFMLNKLANHKLVVYGEMHKRKASWDLLKSVIKDPAFPKKTGIVFLEMSSDSQEKMNRFFSNKKMDREILLDVLRDVQMEGWDDRGMYEFVIDLWNLNRKLGKKEKIKVVLTDIPRPFGSLKTKEEFGNHFKNVTERNKQMADIIEMSMKSSTDKRGGFFIVGLGHVFKAKIKIGEFSYVSAGAQLKERFSDKDVYTAVIHMAIMDNMGNVEGLTRDGLFDYVFDRNENKPVAFNLAGSPFGKEDYDAILDFRPFGIGDYENNYDGYIFLIPLKNEGPRYLLPELITEDFVRELRRRAEISGNNNWEEYGVKVMNITLEDVQKYYQKQTQDKYWSKLK